MILKGVKQDIRIMKRLIKGDTVAIVSLSHGFMNQQFQIDRMVKNLEGLGLKVFFPENSRRSFSELSGWKGAKLRAEDLKQVFDDKKIKAVFASIGGDDTYRTLPYLMEDLKFLDSVKNNPKIFSGYSDTTVNHLMFYKIGMTSFYGPNGLSDLAEMSGDILPYTKRQMRLFFDDDLHVDWNASEYWYEEYDCFDEKILDLPRKSHLEEMGFDFLRGNGKICGQLLGGCIETLTDMCSEEKNQDSFNICKKYKIFPDAKEWKGKIVFLESSSSEFNKDEFLYMLNILDRNYVLNEAKCLLFGKFVDFTNYNMQRNTIIDYFSNDKYKNIPIIMNMNFGHTFPKSVLQYGGDVCINFDSNKIRIRSNCFHNI
ncbi:MAG: LD-carboxypeptidase [Lachnospiraceae bacterium]|nr:LD-carboxypeptidase [Lachnospiraceae bacterium]